MKAFWKNHPALRMVLMLVLFVLSIALVISRLENDRAAGWSWHHAFGGGRCCWLYWCSITPPIGIEEKREVKENSHGRK